MTHSYLRRIQPGNLHDPLLRQALPLDEELQDREGFSADPLQEESSNPVPGLLHKYHGRVLLTVTGSCAIHCRYCFRRHFPYEDNNAGRPGWPKIIEYINADPSIAEVILSGGDPLNLNDRTLASLVHELANIPHVQRLRLHTRLPIVLPERVTNDMIAWLMETRLQPVIVVHCNHPNEIDVEVTTAIQKLREEGICLLNQAVLLRGVNDDVDTLTMLSTRLFELGVLPYYLHMLDKVKGAWHFAIPDETAKALHRDLSAKLPGYLVPRLVQEVPFAAAKIGMS